MTIDWAKDPQLDLEITRDEGCINHPYHDLRGYLTIGKGWNLDTNPLPDEIIQRLYEIAVYRAVDDLSALLPAWGLLDEARARAMLNLTYNLGRHTLSKFYLFLTAMREYCRTADPKFLWSAATELLDSAAARENPSRYGHLAMILRGS